MEALLKDSLKVLSGFCPDLKCHTKLFFPAYDLSIECTSCGQRHEQKALTNVEDVTDPEVALHKMLHNVLLGNTKPKKGTDSVRVLGLSNYQCKLISPLLTKYGMDKRTGRAKLLSEMGQGQTFDCAILAERAFLIELEHIDVTGYGRDRTGSVRYLSDTLETIQSANENEERLVAIHADGDGHCLVHAISRCLIGRELFWHALRVNLESEFKGHLNKYKELFSEFINKDEWSDIIAECDPYYTPRGGEALGLRNIHIFGLANVLRRPIVLLDSLAGMQSSGDYSGVFLPGLHSVEECRAKDGQLNKPLCIAWSSAGYNHYIPLVPIKGRKAPILPRWMLPKVWGLSDSLLDVYLKCDGNEHFTIGGDKCLGDRYVQRLVRAMEEIFLEKFKVSPSLVADVHQYVYKSTGMVGVRPDVVLDATQCAVKEHTLYRCLMCDAITRCNICSEWLQPGGSLYVMAEKIHGTLRPDKAYNFPLQGIVCTYDEDRDTLVPDMKNSHLTRCGWCQGSQMRHVRGDGTMEYLNGDRTTTPATSSKCQCGFKHYWDGKEYDNLPETIPVTLDWDGKVHVQTVYWFQQESDPSLNSNVFDIAQCLVQRYYPGEFGSERLVQKVVNTILRLTAEKEAPSAGEALPQSSFQDDVATKIILTGHKHKTLHKEELTASETEKSLKTKIEKNASLQQKRRSLEKDAASNMPLHKGHTTKTLANKSNSSTPALVENTNVTGIDSKTTDNITDTTTTDTVMDCTTTENIINSTINTTDYTVNTMDSTPTISHATTMSSEVITGTITNLTAAISTTTSVVTEATTNSSETGKVKVEMKIRLTTSDGRQIMMSLDPDCTIIELQNKIEDGLSIARERQKLRYGFPPKELHASIDGTLPLQHGDRIMVEILPDPQEVAANQNAARSHQSKLAWSNLETQEKDQSAEDMLKGLDELQSGGDSLDMAISSLSLMATLTGRDLWSYVQTMPHLFSVGGLYYKQVDRDLGLSDGKHCTLPTIQSKVFCYNASEDRLELCLEPRGHFAIEPGIEHKVLNTGLFEPSEVGQADSDLSSDASQTLSRILSSGSSGVLANPSMKGLDRTVPFQGQGHSLIGHKGQDHSHTLAMGRENVRMPMDILPRDHSHVRKRAMKLNDFTQNSSHPDTINEDPTDDIADPVFKRVGPGYTVLDQDVANEVNSRTELLRTLVSSIQASYSSDQGATLDENLDSDDSMEST